MEQNTITSIDDYRNAIFSALPQLEILDAKDKDGQSVYSIMENEEEEGELEQAVQDEIYADVLARLDPETKEKIDKGEMSLEDLKGMGIIGDSDEYGNEQFGEEGEAEVDENSEEPSAKRQKEE